MTLPITLPTIDPLFDGHTFFSIAEVDDLGGEGSKRVSGTNSTRRTELLAVVEAALKKPRQDHVHRWTRSLASGSPAEELAWTRSTLVWLVNGTIFKHWSYQSEMEEIRHACRAGFEMKQGENKGEKRAEEGIKLADEIFPEENHAAVFGTYGKAKRSAATSIKGQISEPQRISAICVFFRTFYIAYLDDGSEYRMHLPFLVSKVWPLLAPGVLLEAERAAEDMWSSDFLDSDTKPFFSIVNPLRPPAPVGLAHAIRNNVSDVETIYVAPNAIADDPIQQFTRVHPDQRLLFVESIVGQYPVLVTINPNTQTIYFYYYSYSSTTFAPKVTSHLLHSTSLAEESIPIAPKLQLFPQLAAEWLTSETPPPASWREGITSQPAPFPDLTMGEDDEEDRQSPAIWLHLLGELELNKDCADAWENIRVEAFDGPNALRKYAVYLPSLRAYRVASLGYKIDIPWITTSRKTISMDVNLYPATAIFSVNSTRVEEQDLLVEYGHAIQCTAGQVPVPFQPKVNSYQIQVEDASRASFVVQPGIALSLEMRSRSRLVNEILDTVQKVLPDSTWSTFRQLHLSRRQRNGQRSTQAEFDMIRDALLDVLQDGTHVAEQVSQLVDSWESLSQTSTFARFKDSPALDGLTLPPIAPVSPPLRLSTELGGPVLYALHLLAQGLKIDSRRTRDCQLLVSLVLKIANSLAPAWADYWSRHFPDLEDAFAPRQPCAPIPLLPSTPPDFIETCMASCMNKRSYWICVSDLRRIFGLEDIVSYSGIIPQPILLLRTLQRFFSNMATATGMTITQRAESLLFYAYAHSWTNEFIDALPLALGMPIREVLRICQLSAKVVYQPKALRLVDRMDMYAILRGKPARLPVDAPDDGKEALLALDELVQKATKAGTGSFGPSMEAGSLARDSFTEIRWSEDRRLEEVALMLSSSRTPVVRIVYSGQEGDHEKEQQDLVFRVSERTLSLSPGRALLTYSCTSVATPDAFVVPKMEFSVRIMPENAVLSLEASRLTQDSKGWAHFHNGAASGLRISSLSASVESTWLQYIKPNELSAEHAGFILGLGLNGHLKKVDTWNTYAYLSPKHELTSIAVLLGLAASNVGSSSHFITRIIAVHTPALLPVRSVNINVSLLTQSAGLVALGLVFLGTGDRGMGDMLLKEISRDDRSMSQASGSTDREAYSLSAGIGFGMIMVGKGSKMAGAAERNWLERFNVMVHGSQGHVQGATTIDPNVTAPGACLALAMMYLKTNRADVAEMLSLPTTRSALDSISPSLLLLRTLATSLIMWDSIQPSLAWINSHFEALKVLGTSTPGPLDPTTNNAIDIAVWNIVAGACFALSIKYAGTASAEAWRAVVFYYDILLRGALTHVRGYEQSIRRQATRDMINVMSCAMSIIMAGSGDVNCLARLRFAHGSIGMRNKFGMHFANHMALGVLFLGGGRFTLGTSNAAVCALLASFYPRFPLFAFENRFHLQALRHLWSLAIEPRCLITRDVDTGKVIYLPVKVKIEDQTRVGGLQLMAPTLLPEFDLIRAIRVDSPRYWPFFIDFGLVPTSFKESFIRHQTLWVKRRRDYLSYMDDPHCARSSLVGAQGGIMGDRVLLMASGLASGVEADKFINYIKPFSSDPTATSFTDRLCVPEPNAAKYEKGWSAYSQATLIASFEKDKPQMISTASYLEKFATGNPTTNPSYGSFIHDLDFLISWYRQSQLRRQDLLTPFDLYTPRKKLEDKIHELEQDASFVEIIFQYVNGEGLDPMNQMETGERLANGRKLAFFLQQTVTPSPEALYTLKHIFMTNLKRLNDEGKRVEDVRRGLTMMLRQTVANGDREWRLISLDKIISQWIGEL